MTKASDVILVHGGWADGSSWSKVIPLLLGAGLRVTAVQLPLISLKDDVAAVKRAIVLQDGPIILVGRSYGGEAYHGRRTPPVESEDSHRSIFGYFATRTRRPWPRRAIGPKPTPPTCLLAGYRIGGA